MKNRHEIKDDVVVIHLRSKVHGDQETIISREDLELVNSMPYTWYVKQGGFRTGLYVAANIYNENNERKTIRLHQWIKSPSKGMEVDHINHNPLDNRRNNLRVVTSSLNQLNRKRSNKGNPTLIQGVSYRKDINKYRARVYKDRELIYSKHFKCLKDAEQAAKNKRRALMKEDD